MKTKMVILTAVSALLVYFLGAALGSFFMVILRRRGSGRSWAKGRSVCESCGKELRWWEMIPSISYLMLRGKCSRCGAKIAPSHFIGETAAGILFEVAFWIAWLLVFI